MSWGTLIISHAYYGYHHVYWGVVMTECRQGFIDAVTIVVEKHPVMVSSYPWLGVRVFFLVGLWETWCQGLSLTVPKRSTYSSQLSNFPDLWFLLILNECGISQFKIVSNLSGYVVAGCYIYFDYLVEKLSCLLNHLSFFLWIAYSFS